ncbi:hypothetical protein B0T18DRAFT_417976 [Schizothecium vesticola]|uniref:DUF6536 domain-containing protein n=1 Tax=Schizothecium vesticola TaxID=314040 RepID=A0AA40JZF8_9PEZI|nr:hypothetical protein B0T18DRAFT_417976 [Schizothecium vesticola]
MASPIQRPRSSPIRTATAIIRNGKIHLSPVSQCFHRPPLPTTTPKTVNVDLDSPRARGDQYHQPVPFDNRQETRPKGQKSVIFFAGCVTLVFAVNLTCAIWATIKRVGGIAVLANSSCSGVKLKNTLINLVIDVLSPELLAGSNFSMQCLIGPTRSMVDSAH